MNGRYWIAALGAALLAACARHDAVPGAVIIDETAALSRAANSDTATRKFTVNDDSIVVAFADEQLTDVRLKIAATDAAGKALNFTESENHLAGAGIEIKLFTGTDGNATALRDIWASGADVVHFATHALADLRQPIASLLVLPATDAHGNPTYLTAGQVQAWRGDTELVFLSACESAIGPPQYAAGMPGLQRAWLVPDPGISAADQLRRRITALAHAYFAG